MSRKAVRIVAFVTLAWTAAVDARQIEVVRDNPLKILQSAVEGAPVRIAGVSFADLGVAELELQPTQVWADDARVVVHQRDGTTTELPPPRTRTFKGTIAGHPDSAVFLSLHEDGRIDSVATVGHRRFRISTGEQTAIREGKRERFAEAPVIVRELDDFRESAGLDDRFRCDLEPGVASPHDPFEHLQKGRIRSDAGNRAGATYRLRLAIETDDEFYAAFGSVSAVTDHLTILAGFASLIYERDVATTLLIGHTNIYSGGPGSDPWTGATSSEVLNELGTWYATNNSANYGQVQRSAVVMVSGRTTSSGRAWLDKICGPDELNTPGVYKGAYAFCGSPGSGVRTTVPDPTLTLGGVQYRVPTDAVFWMLSVFAHELGHVIGSPHSHCVPLTPQEKIDFNVNRDWVDLCDTECQAGSTTAPPELGTIMSYCHNITFFDFGTFQTYRQSRYVLGKVGEPSQKMLAIFKEGLEAATPDPAITANENVPCAAGQAASVATCGGCTYQWAIEGGTITSSTAASSITYTPSAGTTTLTVTVTTSRGCGIRLSRVITTQCVSVQPPTNVVATATSTTSVQVSWTAAANATSYNVYRSAGGAYVLRGSSNSTAFVDSGATAGTAYLYKVRSVNGGESSDSNADLATTVVFTDATLTAGTTTIKSAHFNELRTAVNAVRTLASLSAFSYTSPVPSSVVTIRKVHLDELRTNVQQARTALGLPAATFVETLVTGSTTVKASHITEIREAVR